MTCKLAESPPQVLRRGEHAVATLSWDQPCTGCNELGYRRVFEDGAARLQACEGLYARRRIELFNRARIPARFASADFGSFSVGSNTNLQDAHGTCSSWSLSYLPGNPEARPGIILSGPPGVGKTHLLVAILRRLTLDKGIPCAFTDHVELVQTIKAGWDKGHGSGDLLETLATIEVLLIDDLGQGQASEWNRTLIDTLVTRRYNAGLATLATTNFALELSPEEKRKVFGDQGARTDNLSERVGGRVVSRLIGGAQILSVRSRDFRRRSPEFEDR